MDVLIAFVHAIPKAAASPLALVAFLATVLAWVAVAYRVNRFRELMKALPLLKEDDRLKAIRDEIGAVDVPHGLTGEQYLRKRKDTFVFGGFLVLCGTVVIVIVTAGYDVYQQKSRADNLSREVLSVPSPDYMSAANTLANGPQMVEQAAAEIHPPLSDAELDAYVDRLAQEGLTGQKISALLAERAGTSRLKRASEVLAEAASRIGASYEKLAECFRQIQCRRGPDTEKLCEALIAIRTSINNANVAARKIPGVNFSESGTQPMLGGGSMDVAFSKVSAGNVDYLLTVACDA